MPANSLSLDRIGMQIPSPLLTSLIFLFLSACDGGRPVEAGPPFQEQDGILYHVAGRLGVGGNDGDGSLAVESLLYWPVAITAISGGEILVADLNNNRIRKISRGGVIDRFVGLGTLGDDDSGPGSIVKLNHPADIAVGPDGSYFVADHGNSKVKVFDAPTLNCSVVAGGGGFHHEPPLWTQLARPAGLVFDRTGNLFIVDQGNNRIIELNAVTKALTTSAGRGRGYKDGFALLAQFAFPQCNANWCGRPGIDISSNGEDLYVADTENHVIRKISIAAQLVTTIAGTPMEPGWGGDGGPALSAHLNYPTDIDVANNGDIYVADSHNHVVRKINSAGVITTVAGTGVPGGSPSGTRAVEAMLNQPEGLTFDDATNTLYICDTYNHLIVRVIHP
jgi:sugar lactone lactonase YvrE